MDTTIILNGYSVLDDPSVGTTSGAGYQGGGQITVSGGTQPFESDDIVTFQVKDATSDLEVDGSSSIIGITVYDSADDYLSGTVKYDYGPMNPDQTATIQSDLSGLGDIYLRFNGSVLVSDDPDAPQLSNIFAVAGTDLRQVAEGETLTVDRYVDNDYDEDGTIESGTVEEANAAFATQNNQMTVICLAAGTLVETPDGPRQVETLVPGDLVTTLDDGPQPLAWIGRRRVPADKEHAPIRIAAGTLGAMRDVYVSPNHRMLIEGQMAELLFGEAEMLVAAKHLINDKTIRPVPRDEIEYVHVLFDRHQIIFAEGALTESMHPGCEAMRSLAPETRDELLELFPELERRPLSRPALTAREARLLRA
ncbi:Hint domain-containing protein [Histidinibacterium aquaticum]|uniref:Hint domain-containing protein n=1 Tax=Histidinibacterium aquaticum TaxID=2613962 RepID=A0A5J5GRD5_9RHOB|nr:Hint domain-containing protein [Histidinibacterium aquaticum]KAA9010128.1 Hint domain-containing protein [Histidinibacterium aquaticum]